MLEELEAPYEVHAIDLQTNRQKSEDLADIMPNGKIPARGGRGKGPLDDLGPKER